MRSEKVRISCSILRSNSEIGDMTLAKCPGLQPGRRIAREKVRSRVLCVRHVHRSLQIRATALANVAFFVLAGLDA